MPPATWRHSLGEQPIHAFGRSLCVPERDVSHNVDEQYPPAPGSPEIRKEAQAQKDSRRFPLSLAQYRHCLLGGIILLAPSRQPTVLDHVPRALLLLAIDFLPLCFVRSYVAPARVPGGICWDSFQEQNINKGWTDSTAPLERPSTRGYATVVPLPDPRFRTEQAPWISSPGRPRRRRSLCPGKHAPARRESC